MARYSKRQVFVVRTDSVYLGCNIDFSLCPNEAQTEVKVS